MEEKKKKEIVEPRVIEASRTHGRKTERYLSVRGSTGVEALSTRSIYNNYKAQCNEAAVPFTVPSDIGLFHYGKSALIVQINRSFFSNRPPLSITAFLCTEEGEGGRRKNRYSRYTRWTRANFTEQSSVGKRVLKRIFTDRVITDPVTLLF